MARDTLSCSIHLPVSLEARTWRAYDSGASTTSLKSHAFPNFVDAVMAEVKSYFLRLPSRGLCQQHSFRRIKVAWSPSPSSNLGWNCPHEATTMQLPTLHLKTSDLDGAWLSTTAASSLEPFLPPPLASWLKLQGLPKFSSPKHCRIDVSEPQIQSGDLTTHFSSLDAYPQN